MILFYACYHERHYFGNLISCLKRIGELLFGQFTVGFQYLFIDFVVAFCLKQNLVYRQHEVLTASEKIKQNGCVFTLFYQFVVAKKMNLIELQVILCINELRVLVYPVDNLPCSLLREVMAGGDAVALLLGVPRRDTSRG